MDRFDAEAVFPFLDLDAAVVEMIGRELAKPKAEPPAKDSKWPEWQYNINEGTHPQSNLGPNLNV